MCTAISVKQKNHYFGRNLDYEHTFGEKVTIAPRNYEFHFRNGISVQTHSAIIGMALEHQGYPLYFDATNEEGLCIAGLNFPDYAMYMHEVEGRDNIPSFELIPWILSQCKTVSEAKKLLLRINITSEAFADAFQPTPLHWLIADDKETITVEPTKEGMKLYDNSVDVLTNSPPFPMQMLHLSNYMNLSPNEPSNQFAKQIDLQTYSRGMGSIGLPGDFSSMSRFVRACFVKLNSIYETSEHEFVQQFFHLLYSVYQTKGCVKVGDSYEMTNYSSCCNATKGIYYFTTYYDNAIRAVDMYKENLEEDSLIIYEINASENFKFLN